MSDKKEAKKLANKRYYEKIKAKLHDLDVIKKESQDKPNDASFFFAGKETQKPPQIILQAPEPTKVPLKNRILETAILSIVPIIPLIIKTCLAQYRRQQSSQQSITQESETQLNMQYATTNSLDF